MTTETLILKSLITNETFCRATLPFLKEEYFQEKSDKTIFNQIKTYLEIYNSLPTTEALKISLSESSLKPDVIEESVNAIEELNNPHDNDLNWLLDTTEKFCKERAIHNAILESIHIINDEKSSKDKGEIPELLKNALSVSFDPAIGHDLLEEWEQRYEFYHKKEQKIPFDISQFNEITNGGVSRKTLNVILAGVNVGKSLAMCHFATTNLMQGNNVLYITLEMAEEKIAERIDANLLDVSINNLNLISKNQYQKLIENASKTYSGKLIVKEYPTSSANVNHFRFLLNELKLKKKFIPDVIYIDYLNICASSRLKYNSSVNSYVLIKSIAEEIRALAVEFNVPIITATQLTRSGYASSDPDLTDTSESFGLPAVADFLFALVNTDELEKLGQLMVKQLKNRYSDVTKDKTFYVGIDRTKMKLTEMKSSTHGIELDDEPEIKIDKDYYNKLSKFSQFNFK